MWIDRCNYGAHARALVFVQSAPPRHNAKANAFVCTTNYNVGDQASFLILKLCHQSESVFTQFEYTFGLGPPRFVTALIASHVDLFVVLLNHKKVFEKKKFIPEPRRAMMNNQSKSIKQTMLIIHEYLRSPMIWKINYGSP